MSDALSRGYTLSRARVSLICISTLTIASSLMLTGCRTTDTPRSATVKTVDTIVNAYQSDGGTIATYTDDALRTAKQRGDRIGVFVQAARCATCQLALKNFTTQTQSSIPDGVTILLADFDTDTSFVSSHDIRLQHTTALFDTSGTHVGNVEGSIYTMSDLISTIMSV